MTLSLLHNPTPDRALSLVSDVRQEDQEEWVAASCGRPILASLLAVLPHGDNWCLVDEEGRCLCIWGICAGNAWLIATKSAVPRAPEIHRYFKQGIARMHEIHEEITALAYDKNTLHHLWMLHLGFKDTGKVVRMGLPGCHFKQFTRRT